MYRVRIQHIDTRDGRRHHDAIVRQLVVVVVFWVVLSFRALITPDDVASQTVDAVHTAHRMLIVGCGTVRVMLNSYDQLRITEVRKLPDFVLWRNGRARAGDSGSAGRVRRVLSIGNSIRHGCGIGVAVDRSGGAGKDAVVGRVLDLRVVLLADARRPCLDVMARDRTQRRRVGDDDAVIRITLGPAVVQEQLQRVSGHYLVRSQDIRRRWGVRFLLTDTGVTAEDDRSNTIRDPRRVVSIPDSYLGSQTVAVDGDQRVIDEQ